MCPGTLQSSKLENKTQIIFLNNFLGVRSALKKKKKLRKRIFNVNMFKKDKNK